MIKLSRRIEIFYLFIHTYTDRGGNLHRYAVVQYYFTSGVEHPVEPAPHRSSKKRDKAYGRTWESTKDAIRQENNSANLPREAVRNVIENVGGV